MKTNLKLIVAAAIALTMVWSSCKKAEKAPSSASTGTPVTDAAASQIAVNLSNSLNGNYGGTNANFGVDSISFNNNHCGPQHQPPASPLCGFFTDSVVNYNTTVGDTLTEHTGGNLTFYFNCTNGRPNGYKAYDSLNTTGTGTKSSFQKMVKQAYTIQCLNSDDTFNGVNGDIYAYIEYDFFDKSIKPNIAAGNYVLKNLVVNLRDHDVVSGSATFQAYGTNEYGSWHLSGAMTFIGNHLAIITINGKTYIVNIITGQLTSH